MGPIAYLVIGLLPLTQIDPLTHVNTLSAGLDGPARIAITASEVLVTDPKANAVVRFDLAGTLIGSWPEPAGPVGVAVHADGRIFVSRRDDAKVGVYDANFVFQHFLADGVVTFAKPTDLTIDDTTGRIYVLDSGGDRFYAFNGDESLALIVGLRGSRSSEFKHPAAIAVDPANDRILIADQDNFRVQVFSRSGLFVRRFGYRIKYLPGGTSEGWFARAAGLSTDGSGRVYVTDALMGTLRIFTADGAELGKVVDYGTTPGALRTPTDVEVDGTGRIFVVNGSPGTVEVYAAPVTAVAGMDEGTFYPGTNAGEYDLLARRLSGGAIRSRGKAGSIEPSGKSASLMVIPGWDPPHMLDDLTCSRCHNMDGQPGGHLGLTEGQANLCRSCHTGGGQAFPSIFKETDVADPYGTNPDVADARGRSHAWGVPAVNADADSVGPAPGSLMVDYLDGGNIKCATCHDQHNNDVDVPLLRVFNEGDAMCKECHAARDRGLGAGGSHPVGFLYPAGTGEFPALPPGSALPLKDAKVECSTCHAMHAADSGGANGGLGDGMLIRTANDETLCQTCHADHATHAPSGPWQPTCRDCHDVHDPDNVNLALIGATILNQTLGVPKPVVFTALTGPHSFDDGDPAVNDGVCQVCHTTTAYHRQDGGGVPHYDGEDCTGCHIHSAGFMPAGGASCIACHASPQGPRPAVVNPDGSGGHHLAGAVLTNADCVTCHDTSQHQGGTIRLWDDPNNPTTAFGVTGDPTQLEAFCGVCHTGAGHPIIHTTGAAWEPTCTQCHELHDPANTNLSLVRDVVHNQTTATDMPVIFTALTGPNSFDDGDPAANDGICQVCHTTTAYHKYDGTGVPHNDGLNCTSCHGHDNGFIPVGGTSCIGCHANAQGPRPAVVNPDGSGGHHLAGALLTDTDCVTCHDTSLHQGGTVRLWDDPTAPTTSFGITGDPAQFEPFCSACHTGANHPTIHTSGAAWEPTCIQCHELHDPANINLGLVRDVVHNETTAVDMPVVLTARTGPNSFDDGDPAVNDGICQVCHTNTLYHMHDGSGTAHHNGEDCISCHTHDAGFIPAGGTSCIGCHSSPQGPHGAVVNPDGTGGHNIIGPLTDPNCVLCHEMSQHQAGTVRLWDNPTAPTAPFAYTGDPAQIEPFCAACHDHTHIATHPTRHDSGVPWEPSCMECHELHDPANTNLSLVQDVIHNQTTATDMPVVFTALTGPNSFDDGDPAANDGVCQVCHTATIYHKADGSGISHNDGTDCTTCHTHAAGFIPAGGVSCIGCHSSVQGARPAVVNADGSGGHHLAGAVLTDTDCVTCHETSLHQGGTVRLWDDPTAPTTAFGVTGDPTQLEPFCGVCHTGAGHPIIHTSGAAWEPTCTQCHELHDPNSANLFLVNDVVHNQTTATDMPVVFTALTGPNSFDDGDPAANDGICQVCHTNTLYHTADGTGIPHNNGTDCSTCHVHDNGFIPVGGVSCIGCHSSVQGARPAVVNADGSGGHHLAGAVLTDTDCVTCHETSLHQGGTVRLWDDPNNHSTAFGVTGNPTQLESFCGVCHTGAGHPIIHTTGAAWEPSCTQCHELHDPNNANLFLVNDVVHNQTTATDMPVVFTALTGANSFDDGDPAANDGICQVCHTATIYHTADGSGLPHNNGTDCSTCHVHDNGFIPVGGVSCIGCHSTVQGARSAVVNADGSGGHHLAGAVLTDTDCVTCHETSLHQGGTVRLWDDPTAPTTAFGVTGDPTQLEPFCGVCHTGAGHPIIHTTGAAWEPSCTQCHELHDPNNANLFLVNDVVHNQTTATDMPVVFTALTGPNSFDDGDPAANDGICQVCHTTTLYHLSDGSGIPHANGTDCTTCHAHDNGFIPAGGTSCIGCHSSAQGARPAVVNADGSGGHHLAGAVLTDADCTTCHETSQHLAGMVRLWDDPNNPTTAFGVTGDPTQLEPFCGVCHTGAGHPIIHTTGAAWEPSCTQCHELHDPNNANLFLVNDVIHNQTTTTDMPVVFTALTGANSFDDGDPAVNDGICQVCHTATIYHTADGSGVPHNNGTNCTTCHTHAAGFIPAGGTSCIGCHSSAQGARPAVVNADGSGGHHLAGAVLTDTDCVTCHETSLHQGGTVRLWDDPTAPTTAFGVTGDPTQLEPFCGVCHTGAGHPIIHTTGAAWEPSCTQCHELHDPSNANLFLVNDVVHNQTTATDMPVVFTALTGANSFNDGDPAVNDGICQVCHTTTLYHTADGSGTPHNDGTNCTTCHTHAAGFIPTGGTSCIGCHSSAQGARPAVVNADGSGGHHLAGAVLTDTDCTTCHETSLHQGGTVRLWDDPNSPTTAFGVTGDPTQLEPFCGVCHTGAGHPIIHTTGAAWEPSCTQCHELHDPSNANLFLVNDVVHNQTTATDMPVVFTALTGANSFDDGDPAVNDGICQVCHTTTLYHTADGSGLAHNNGTNCTTCHTHAAGFIPTGGTSCIGCHSSAQGARPAVVNADGSGGHHLAGAVLTDTDCVTCHETSLHQGGTVRLWTDPTAPTTAFGVTGDPTQLEPFCGVCHTGAGHPIIHTTGAAWEPSCTQCHELHDPANANLFLVNDVVHNQTTATDMPVVFTALTGANSFDDGDPAVNDGICQVCHTATIYHVADGSGVPHNNGTNCTTCHTHDAGFIPAGGTSCIGCHSSAQGARPAVVNADGSGGHHLAGAVLTDTDCTTCHETSLHQGGTVRLWDDPNSPTTAFGVTGDPTQLEPFCGVCHTGAGHPIIHTTGAAWEPSCTQCHELHDPNNANLFLVNDVVHNQTTATDMPVVFTALTGANSFDDGDPAANDGICQVCHTATLYHTADGSGTPHNDGTNCTTCHAHDAGFIPAGGTSCIGCHSSAQGARPAVVNADGSGGHHLAGAVLTDTDCTTCHETSLHQGGTVRLWDDPTAPTTAFGVTGDPTQLEPFCGVCHTGAGHPIIHTTGAAWEPSCTQCHELHDPNNANLFLVNDVVHNQTTATDMPVVFTALTGPNSFDDGDPAVNDGICQVCHTTTIYHTADGSGIPHNNGTDCSTCHVHDNGFIPVGGVSCIGCHSTTQGARPAVVNADGSGGHHLAGAVLTDTDCVSCHETSLHQGGTVRLWDDPTAPTTAFGVTGDPTQLEPFCGVCHTGAGHPIIHTTGAAWEPSCTQCHELHDPANANLFLVNDVVHNQTTATDMPVVFTALTGANSFDDGDPAANDGICQVCHTATVYHTADGSGFPHNDGTNCTTCHAHDAGFIPAGGTSCIGCHSSAQGARPAVVNADGSGGHHLAGAVLTDTDCVTCHETSLHQGGTVRLWDDPTAPTTAFGVTGDPTQLEPFCGVCHTGAGHPIIHTTGAAWEPTCTQCHELHDPNSANLFLVNDVVHNQTTATDMPVVFTALTGANSFDDGDPAANDGICQVCHTATLYHMGDGSGIPHNNGTNCTTCHAHDAGFIPAGGTSCIGCHSSAQGARPAVVNADGSGGHHLAGAVLTDADCVTCHETSLHQGGTVRLWTDPTAPTTAFGVTGDPTQLEPFCGVCHTGAGHPIIHTTGAAWEPSCTQCHELHDPANANLFLVNDVVHNQTTATDMPVVFTALTGANSFDDGDPAANDGICQVCHTVTTYHRHDGTGTAHNNGTDCTGCHPHESGFLPTSGSCSDCHVSPQNARRAVLGEFALASHHLMGASVDDADCEVCHEMTQHQQGSVRLKNADDPTNPAAVVALTGNPMASATEAAKLEAFCLACHDANAAGGAAPFTDGIMPAEIDATTWAGASHNLGGGGQMTCFGDGETFGCHSSGHGSVKTTLLAPYQGGQTPVAGDTLRQEEGMCYTCHDADGPAAVDVQAAFAATNHHNVSSTDQADGSKVECINCHNPHAASASALLANPDTGAVWTGTGANFCLTCHDGAPPAGVTFAGGGQGTGYDKSNYTGTTHATQLPADSCRECHHEHGSQYLSMLRADYVITDYNQYATNDYAICWTCHSEDAVIFQNNVFEDLHDKHVRSARASCYICHDVHAPFDAGEPGLINFDTAFQSGNYTAQFIDGYDASTGFWISGSDGFCYLNCHNKKHDPKDYVRN